MGQHYSNKKRANEANALPDIEVFYVTQADCDEDARQQPETGADYSGPGWYWWTCFPGCLPDGEPSGPFATEQEAIEDAPSCDECRDVNETKGQEA